MFTLICALYIGGFISAVVGCLSQEDKLFYLGGMLLIVGVVCSILYIISPACFDGSLTGEAYVRACS